MYARSLRQREQIHGRVFHTCTRPAQPRRARTVLHTQRCSMIVLNRTMLQSRYTPTPKIQPTACAQTIHELRARLIDSGATSMNNEAAATIGHELYPLVAGLTCVTNIYLVFVSTILHTAPARSKEAIPRRAPTARRSHHCLPPASRCDLALLCAHG